jgi:small subunit ribosomal protein S1
MSDATAPLGNGDISAGTAVKGKVTYLGVYGAMVDIQQGRDALLHISQLGQTGFRNIEDVLKIGDEIEAYVLKVDGANRIALTMQKPPDLSWSHIKKGEVYTGVVTRIENYGAFVDIGAERPGMVHVSEMSDGYVQAPSDVVKVGDKVEVRVLNLNRKKHQIDLSMKTPEEEVVAVMEPAEDIPTPMELAFRRAQKQAQKDRKGKKEKNARYDQDDIISRTLRSHR